MKDIDFRELHFFKYRLYGKTYLKFYKTLKRLGIEFLIEHGDEFYYLSKYKEYGPEFLKFLSDAIELRLNEIVDLRNFRESRYACILKWVFRSLDRNRRDENN